MGRRVRRRLAGPLARQCRMARASARPFPCVLARQSTRQRVDRAVGVAARPKVVGDQIRLGGVNLRQQIAEVVDEHDDVVVADNQPVEAPCEGLVGQADRREVAAGSRVRAGLDDSLVGREVGRKRQRFKRGRGPWQCALVSGGRFDRWPHLVWILVPLFLSPRRHLPRNINLRRQSGREPTSEFWRESRLLRAK